MKKKSFLPIIFVSVFFLFAVCTVLFLIQQTRAVSSDENLESAVRIEIPYGMSVKNVASLLKENGIIKNDTLFYISVRFPAFLKVMFPGQTTNAKFSLKSGTYYLQKNMDYPEIQKILSSGQTEYAKVVIPEGLTISRIGMILEENRICSLSDFKSACKNQSMLKEYGIPAESFEGYLFPDTYFLNIGMKAESVVSIMVDNFFTKIKEVPALSEKNAEDLNQILILASIVEREYRVADEAPLIASVFKNRLKYNIGLYSCATVVYILTEIEGRPHPEKVYLNDLKIDNPYNTYKYAGLTPGPISNPGLVALNAAANTPKTNYFFFQVDGGDSGRHVFAETFDEHKTNHNLSVKK